MRMRKTAVMFLAAAFAAMPLVMSPSPASAAEITGELYIPDEAGVALGSNGGGNMGIGFDLDKTMKKEQDSRTSAGPTQAEIWLIGANIDMRKLSADTVDAWYRDKKIPAGQPIYYTKADAKGKFDIKDVPEGDYYLVIVNNYVPGRGSDLDAVKALETYLPDYEMFQLFVTGYSAPTAVRFHLAPHEIGSFSTMPAPVTASDHPAYGE